MKINAAFARYAGEPVSIHSAILQPKNGSEILVISKQSKLTMGKDEETALIVDSNIRENYDMLFSIDRLGDAIDAYKTMQSAKQILIDHALAGRYSPDHSIEMAGISANGKIEYRTQEISNGQIAILASCLYFTERNGFNKATSFADRMQNYFVSV